MVGVEGQEGSLDQIFGIFKSVGLKIGQEIAAPHFSELWFLQR